MDTESLYLALSEEELYHCIREESKAEWGLLRTEYCKHDFTAKATNNFLPRTCCTKHIKHDKREAGLFKEAFRCTEMLCLCSKTYCCYDSNSNKYKYSSKSLSKRTLEDCGDGPMTKYRKVLDEFVNVTSTNRGSELFIIVWLLMNRPERACLTFIQRELYTLMVFTLVL